MTRRYCPSSGHLLVGGTCWPCEVTRRRVERWRRKVARMAHKPSPAGDLYVRSDGARRHLPHFTADPEPDSPSLFRHPVAWWRS